MLASISKGNTLIKNLLMGDDVLRTMAAFRAMGVTIRRKGKDILVRGVGMHGLKKPAKPIYLGNSGTTMRILPGILAGQDFRVTLDGDASLSKRPMKRIVEPLRKMGVKISDSGRGDGYPPLKIKGERVKPVKYRSKIASAQVKSCILLAGLFADGVTVVSEPVKSRDHTEQMLRLFGCKLKVKGLKVSVRGPARLKSPGKIEIPADTSSAAFFMVAACILPGMKIILKNVGLNPTRTGVIDILKEMGADIRIEHKSRGVEPKGDVIVTSSRLCGITIYPKEVVRAIDEIPIIMVAACFAKGVTTIRGIKELRVKETDRIRSMVTNLRKMGADIKVKGDMLKVGDLRILHGATLWSFGDHRTAMSMLTAGIAIKGNVRVTGLSCINKSFPGFQKLLRKLN
ncbi:MAG: 3-phosphoshikimate 1-carboxyvinyltransferase [Candidatus Omnitrophica bacterium]|nr:3-phosphoshikimate 1-carboxyvinyltransferase [Candidatus Omnitrophota bacterium]